MGEFWENIKDKDLGKNGQKSELCQFFFDFFSNPKLSFKAGIITDERCMIRNVIKHGDVELHANTIDRINSELNIKNDNGFCDERIVHIFCYDDTLDTCVIVFSEENDLGYGQLSFLGEIFEAFEDFQKNNESRLERELVLETGDLSVQIRNDCSKMRECLKERMGQRLKPVEQKNFKSTVLEEGEFYTTHSEPFKEKELLYNLKIENIETINDVFLRIVNMSEFENSPYYHDLLLRMFPDFGVIEDFYYLYAWSIPDEKKMIEGVTLGNVRQVLIENLDSMFIEGSKSPLSLKNFRNSLALLHGLVGDNPVIPPETIAKIEQVYPNYRFVNEFVETHLLEVDDEIDIRNNKAVKSIHTENGYAAVSKEIINCLYREKHAELQMRKKEQSLPTMQLVKTFLSKIVNINPNRKKQKTIEELELELKELEATGLVSEESFRGDDSGIDSPQ